MKEDEKENDKCTLYIAWKTGKKNGRYGKKNLVFISKISLKITLTILKHNQDKVIYSDGKINQ